MVPTGFRLFQLIFSVIALFIAVFALAMAVFPRRLTRWQMHGPDSTTQIEPSRMRLLMMRLMGIFVAVVALFMAFGSHVILP
ncbi:hypothetical protein C489_20086 [Natrinema versiforme JCM 10478]|uniref:DUF6199 domain-containing protein n=1 Tax=Natrinema versiforme JCM 10478 TaxID=1227496 RepID=L9XMX9_9EURY|nr:hypothetical protein C489_20086 [Natrinema versiforme JCM 10478]